jgi:hypothetical protein
MTTFGKKIYRGNCKTIPNMSPLPNPPPPGGRELIGTFAITSTVLSGSSNATRSTFRSPMEWVDEKGLQLPSPGSCPVKISFSISP